MNEKPVWLLDVDGVINACMYKQNPTVWPTETWRLETICGYPIRWSTEVVDFINKMADIVEIRWHTTWQQKAVTELAPILGIRELPVMPAPGYPQFNAKFGWWKFEPALTVVNEENRPLIWTDDDLIRVEQSRFIAQNVNKVKSILVTPYTEVGLTREHLNAIEEFVEEVCGVSAG